MSKDDKLTFPGFELTLVQRDQIKSLASLGLQPREIAAALGLDGDQARFFRAMADFPETLVASLIASGRIIGRTKSMETLKALAEGGDLEAIKILREIQAHNRFNNLVNIMDEDELTD